MSTANIDLTKVACLVCGMEGDGRCFVFEDETLVCGECLDASVEMRLTLSQIRDNRIAVRFRARERRWKKFAK